MRARIVIALIACALAVVSCGKKEAPQATPSFATDANASASAGANGSPGPTKTSGGGGNNAPTYPKNAKDYAHALLVANSKKDKTRVDQLAQQSAVLQLATYQNLDPNWNTHVSCGPDGGSHTVCVFRNTHGDEASVKLANLQIGHPTAAVEALIDRTTYPSDAAGYASAFTNAWEKGNTDRMKRLSNSGTVDFFKGKTPASGYTAYPTPDGTHTKVKMEGLPVGAFSFVLRIANGSLGKANAITGAQNA
ncbi:hypothetical protein [Allorhizocola rhizosphaerae]|uniref:hypothetical protein n=1 Tax=Allorhizocola rhizosphaerae TaxID=1872709 RepID=UPI000E3D69C4|nr:hypothetical protein [Allorhizocola rhizosphaerae]